MITPAEIYADVHSHPPLMQDDAKAKYIGQEVEWLLAFSSGSVDDDQARLMFHSRSRGELNPFGGVAGWVSLSAYPWLKTLRADELVLVRGRIRRVHFIAIDLDILELALPEPAIA
jgi:hypothetical protein